MPSAGEMTKPLVGRRHPLRITEEIGAPERQRQPEPEQRIGEKGQEKRHCGKGANERPAFAVDGNEVFCGLNRQGSWTSLICEGP